MHCLMTQQHVMLCYMPISHKVAVNNNVLHDTEVHYDALHMMLHCKWGDLIITLRLLSFGRSQQTQDSWAETDRIPISKRCKYLRIDSAWRVLLQSRFTRHTFPQNKIWLNQIQWKCNGPSPL